MPGRPGVKGVNTFFKSGNTSPDMQMIFRVTEMGAFNDKDRFPNKLTEGVWSQEEAEEVLKKNTGTAERLYAYKQQVYGAMFMNISL